MSHTDTYRKSITGQEMADEKARRGKNMLGKVREDKETKVAVVKSAKGRGTERLWKRLWCVWGYAIADSIFKRITLAAVRKMGHKRTGKRAQEG